MCDGGDEERRWLELDAIAEERERELRNEGKRCRGVRGWSSSFYRGGGGGRRWWSDNGQLKSLNALMAGGC
jgi:hypothetical protein